MALSPGTRLGAYEIVSLLGKGGMGEVYRGRDTRLDRTVAIKVLPSDIALDSHLRERFDREARTISHLNHPHICALYDVGETAGSGSDAGAAPGQRVSFLVLEYLQGSTLADRLKPGALPLIDAIDIAIQIADALGDAHAHGIVHRDLKPANVMLTGSSDHAVVKLLDFGLAKSAAAAAASTFTSDSAPTDAALTADGAILGTFQYMSPEQMKGHAPTAGSDIWAFGCVLHEMLTGRDVRVRGRIAPRALNGLIDRCLAIESAERPRAADLVRELRAIRRRVLWRRPLRSAVAVAAVAGVAVAAVVIGDRLLKRVANAPTKPVTVLIADFDNQTSEPVFDGTVEHTLGLALEDSRIVLMYPRRDAAQAAELIERGARLDERVSRLVAQREGVDHVLAGVVAHERGGYVISAHLVDPRRGMIGATATERISDRSKALEAIGRIGQALRRALGEQDATSVLPSDETFTTSSLDAAREYVVGQDLLSEGHAEEAIAHYQKALEHDPRMGRAYAGWAVADHHLGRLEDARGHMAKALDLLSRMNRREQLRTQGLEAQMLMGDYQRAADLYDTLLREYPGDPTGQNNLAMARFMLLDFEAAKAAGATLVPLFPTKHLYRSNLALFAMYAGDLGAAVREAKAAIALNPASGEQYLPLAIDAADRGDLAGTRRWYEAMAKGNARAQRLAVTCLADLLVYTGDLRQARALLTSGVAADLAARSTAFAARKQLMLAEIGLVDGDRPAALDAARRAASIAPTPEVLFRAGMILIESGDGAGAVSLMNGLPLLLQGLDRWYRVVVDTELAIQRREPSAVARFEAQLEKDRGPWFAHLYAGRLQLRTGDAAAAVKHFTWCLQHRAEGAAAYLDDVATIRYWADASYWAGMANETARNLPAATDSYKNFLAARAGATDQRTTDVRRRVATFTGFGR